MTSTSLQNRKKFSALLKSALKKQWIHFAIFAGLTIIALIVWSATDTVYLSDSSSYNISEYMMYSTLIALAVSMIFSFTISSRLFKEIYKKQQCDIYFSIPVKRAEYFTANYLSGVITNFAIYAICILAPLSQSLMYAKRYIPDPPSLILYCLEILIMIFLVYTVFILCAVISGKRIQYVLVCLLLMISSSFAIQGFISKLQTYWGLYIVNFLKMFNFNIVTSVTNKNTDISVLPLINCTIVTIAVFALAFVCFKNRKAEVAQTSLSGKAFPLILLVIFIASAFYYGDSWGPKYIGIIIGLALCAICGLVYSAIFFKKPYTKHSAIITACTAVVCAIISLIPILPNQMRSFEKYVPDADNIKSVSIAFEGESANDYYDYDILSIMNIDTIQNIDFDTEIEFTSPEAIKKVVEYNHAICDDVVINMSKYETGISALKDLLIGDILDNSPNINTYSNYSNNNVLFTYKLKNGRTIKRYYSVANGAKFSELSDILRTQDTIDQCDLFHLKQDDIAKIRISEYKHIKDESDSEYSYYDFDETNYKIKDYNKFIQLYKNDILKYESAKYLHQMDVLMHLGILYDFYDDYDADYGFDADYNQYESDPKYRIELYYFKPGTSQEDKETIRKLNAYDFNRIIDSYLNMYYEDNEAYEYNLVKDEKSRELWQLSKCLEEKTIHAKLSDKEACAYIDRTNKK